VTRCVSFRLTADKMAVREARLRVRELGDLPARTVADAELVVSELVVNSLLHAHLEAGDVIAYPTDTVYGLGCDLHNKRAVERLYSVKGMERTQPLAFICPDLSDIARYAIVENQVYRVLRHFLPGPYCFILEATRDVPKLVQTKRKSVGIRILGEADRGTHGGHDRAELAQIDLGGLGRMIVTAIRQTAQDQDPGTQRSEQGCRQAPPGTVGRDAADRDAGDQQLVAAAVVGL